jgi:hypothetical protein
VTPQVLPPRLRPVYGVLVGGVTAAALLAAVVALAFAMAAWGRRASEEGAEELVLRQLESDLDTLLHDARQLPDAATAYGDMLDICVASRSWMACGRAVALVAVLARKP